MRAIRCRCAPRPERHEPNQGYRIDDDPSPAFRIDGALSGNRSVESSSTSGRPVRFEAGAGMRSMVDPRQPGDGVGCHVDGIDEPAGGAVLDRPGYRVTIQPFPGSDHEIRTCSLREAAENRRRPRRNGPNGPARMRHTMFGGPRLTLIQQTDTLVLFAQ